MFLREPSHWAIVILVLVLLFGWKRLPDMARSVGRSMRIFKSEVDEMKAESAAARTEASQATVEGTKVDRHVDDVVDPVTPPVGDTRPDRSA